MRQRLDITPEQLALLRGLLQQHLPGVEAWAYGSRVKGNARPTSDLDLVVFAQPDQKANVAALREALEESNLAFRVDLFVWDNVPEEFRKGISEDHCVLVVAREGDPNGA